MSLPYDISRCSGTPAPLCKDCQRRTSPGRPEWQSYIPPANYSGNECENYIKPDAELAKEKIE